MEIQKMKEKMNTTFEAKFPCAWNKLRVDGSFENLSAKIKMRNSRRRSKQALWAGIDRELWRELTQEPGRLEILNKEQRSRSRAVL